MDLKIKIPFRKGQLKMFVYNIPPWLVGGLVIVVILIILSLKMFFHS
jgi:hypothetical protein